MRTRLYHLFIVLFTTHFITAQTPKGECGCKQDLKYVVNYIENNLASFADNVDSTNRLQYEMMRTKLMASAAAATNQQTCFRLLQSYVEYFKDEHTSIRRLDDESFANYVMMDFGFFKLYKTEVAASNQHDENLNSSESLCSFQILDSSTAYMKINSFDGNYTAKLDSFYKCTENKIKERPNLIIDLR